MREGTSLTSQKPLSAVKTRTQVSCAPAGALTISTRLLARSELVLASHLLRTVVMSPEGSRILQETFFASQRVLLNFTQVVSLARRDSLRFEWVIYMS